VEQDAGREGVEVDAAFTDERLARVYDAENGWHPQDDFYLALDLAAGAVLDVGCGTGSRLARAREMGHPGLLVGVDPAVAMLAVARAKADRVHWVLGSAQSLDLDRRFDLVTMTGHAFQVLLDDDGVRAALRAFRRHLVPGGLLAFETRNPAARAWECWAGDDSHDVVETAAGERVEVWIDGVRRHGEDLVSFDAHNRFLATGELVSCRSTLRFVDPRHLRRLLEEEGFAVEGWFGDWDRGPVTPDSLEVIVLARPLGE
jgi:SAM-dependent methyltransferase